MGTLIDFISLRLHSHISSALSYPRWMKRIFFLVLDLCLCAVSVLISFYLRTGELVPFTGQGSEWSPIWVLAIGIILSPPIFTAFGLYREIFRYSGWRAFVSLSRAMFFYAIIFFVLFTVVGIPGVPRTIGLIQPFIYLGLIGSSRALISYWFSNLYRRNLGLVGIPRVMIYGAGQAGRQLAAGLSQSHQMEVVGFFDDDSSLHGRTLGGIRIYKPDNIIAIISSLGVDRVLLAVPSISRFRRNQILEIFKNLHIAVETLPSMEDLAHGRVDVRDLRALDIDDLLGREQADIDLKGIRSSIENKTIFVTGAGGSIGSELCRQIVNCHPRVLVLIEQSEFALYKIQQELLGLSNKFDGNPIQLVLVLSSILDESNMRRQIEKYRPDQIYHAAAYKHVPLVEENIAQAIKNNVFGTLLMARLAKEYEVPRFVLVSTDKAVRPTNVMGATKRLAEMALNGLSQDKSKTIFCLVRFGNVLDSSGSVVPLFRRQIEEGGPITITDVRITRYFMTIPEAAKLVLQSALISTGSEIFLLDMGKPVKIIDLAKSMVNLSGLTLKNTENPEGDIEIIEVGIRPGEKLFEELLIEGDPLPTKHPSIFKAREGLVNWPKLDAHLCKLESTLAEEDQISLQILKELVTDYKPDSYEDKIASKSV